MINGQSKQKQKAEAQTCRRHSCFDNFNSINSNTCPESQSNATSDPHAANDEEFGWLRKPSNLRAALPSVECHSRNRRRRQMFEKLNIHEQNKHTTLTFLHFFTLREPQGFLKEGKFKYILTYAKKWTPPKRP